MIASLPMYNWPEQRLAHDEFWQRLKENFRKAGIKCPEKLSHADDETHWLDDQLFLGQTCGYPLVTTLKDQVHYIATPVYNVEGCTGPYYSSAIIARTDSGLSLDTVRDKRFAFNSSSSLSGYRAAKAMFGKPSEFFSMLVETGSHRQSAKSVVANTSDVATIDAVCWHLIQIHEPHVADQLQVLGWTQMRPSLPLITSRQTPLDLVGHMRDILLQFGKFEPLNIQGFDIVDLDEYRKLADL